MAEVHRYAPAGHEGSDDANYETVTCVVHQARRIVGSTVYAMVDVDLVVAGVSLAVCGIQARREPSGGTSIHLPTYKAGDGTWLPAIQLPPEIGTPLANAVLDFLVEEGLAQRRHGPRRRGR